MALRSCQLNVRLYGHWSRELPKDAGQVTPEDICIADGVLQVISASSLF